MLRCQLPRFDQTLACLSLSHQFPMKVFGLQHTPAMSVARISLARFLFCGVLQDGALFKKKKTPKHPSLLCSPPD